MTASDHSLLDALAAEASTLADNIATLEQQQHALRRELAAVRALRAEILWAADELNRQRLA